jgi:antitoxin VapB
MPTAIVVTDSAGQVVRLPAGIHLESEEVFVRQVGHSVVLVPKCANPWQPLLDSLDQFSEDYMADRGQPQLQECRAVFE